MTTQTYDDTQVRLGPQADRRDLSRRAAASPHTTGLDRPGGTVRFFLGGGACFLPFLAALTWAAGLVATATVVGVSVVSGVVAWRVVVWSDKRDVGQAPPEPLAAQTDQVAFGESRAPGISGFGTLGPA